MLLGRRDELGRLQRAVHDRRSVALVGPPGVGKTTLARVALSDARFVDLSSELDVDGVCSVLARHVGLSVAADGDADLVARIGERLRGTVVILDNVEQVEGVEALVEAWDGAMLVITSQRALDLADCAHLGVLPLSDDSIRTLLGPGSRGAGGSQELGADRTSPCDAMDTIVARTGGLPLAAEVYAGALELASPAQLVELLDSTGLGGTALERSIDLATGRLHEISGRALACLSSFEGVFSLLDAGAVLDQGTPVSTLNTLVGLSLVARVRADDRVRFHVLPPVRACVRAELTADDPAWVRHAEHVASAAMGSARAWIDHGTTGRLDEVARWRPDLERIVLRANARVASPALFALSTLLSTDTPAPSVSRTAQLVWDLSSDWPPECRGEAAILYALAIRASRREEAVAVLQVTLDRTPAELPVCARLHMLMSIAVVMLGDPTVALGHATMAASQAMALGDHALHDHALHARALCSSARARRMLLDIPGARADLDAARSLALAQSCWPIVVFAGSQLALLLGSAGELQAAIHHVERAWEAVLGRDTDPMTFTIAAHVRAITWAYAGPAVEALGVLDTSLASLPADVAVRRELELLRVRVDLLVQGPTEPVIGALRKAAASLPIVDNDRFAAEMQNTLALALAWSGQIVAADVALERALEATRRAGYLVGERVARAARAVSAHRRGVDSAEDLRWIRDHPGQSNGTQAIVEAIVEALAPLELPRYAMLDARLLDRLARAGRVAELVVNEDCSRAIWRGRETDLSRRHAARRLLAALVQASADGLTQDAPIAAGWPNERMSTSSGRQRLHSPVRLLRMLGLAAVGETPSQQAGVAPTAALSGARNARSGKMKRQGAGNPALKRSGAGFPRTLLEQVIVTTEQGYRVAPDVVVRSAVRGEP